MTVNINKNSKLPAVKGEHQKLAVITESLLEKDLQKCIARGDNMESKRGDTIRPVNRSSLCISTWEQ